MRIGTYISILFLMFSVNLFAEPNLIQEPENVDFGIVPQNRVLKQQVILYNPGQDTVTIKKINTFCDCIEYILNDSVFLPNETTNTTVKFNSMYYSASQKWRPHILFGDSRIRTWVNATILAEIKNFDPIHVLPHTVVLSQYGNQLVNEAEFKIINNSNRHIPFTMKYYDDEFYNLKFPAFVAPKDTAFGRITLNDKGAAHEFENSFTFEFVDESEQSKHYSVPVIRKIYR